MDVFSIAYDSDPIPHLHKIIDVVEKNPHSPKNEIEIVQTGFANHIRN